MALLHQRHDLLHCRHIVAVAFEDLVAQRQPLTGHHQRDADLLAVRPVIAAVATLGQGVAFHSSLEVGRGDVVEEEVVFDTEQLSKPLPNVLFDFVFVRQDLVQSSIDSILVHLFNRKAQQIIQSGLAVPVLSNVQVTRWLRQSGQDLNSRHDVPRHIFMARQDQIPEDFVEPQSPPQRPAQPHISELTASFNPDSVQSYRYCFGHMLGWLEQSRLV